MEDAEEQQPGAEESRAARRNGRPCLDQELRSGVVGAPEEDGQQETGGQRRI